MDFSFDRKQEMLRSMVCDFAEKELAPMASMLEERGEFPREIAKRMGELGLIGTFAPKQYGGSEMGHLARAIATEEISRVYPSAGFFIDGNDGGIFLLLTGGTEEQKEKYLASLCKADKICCWSITEATGGSNPAAMQTTAELVGSEYVVNGRKVFANLAGMSDLFFFLAKAEEGFNVFVVETGTPGLEIGRRENISGLRSLPNNEVIFTNCRIPKENLVGAGGKGLTLFMSGFVLIARPSVAAVALGIARGCYEAALKFAKERKLYGAPIAELQAIQFMLADMEVEVEAAKWLCYHAAWLIDQGKSSREVAKDTARAKLYASEVARRVSLKAIQLMGGYGVTAEYQVIRWLNDALALFPAGGTSEAMRVTIGREIIRGEQRL